MLKSILLSVLHVWDHVGLETFLISILEDKVFFKGEDMLGT
jgi:hypothetical protein